MSLHYEDAGLRLWHGSNMDVLPTFPDGTFDSIVTDPPYELGFMGKGWDSSGIAYDVDMWRECLRVLKPGGFLLAFGGTRTWHRVAVAVEDAGFEVRDSIAWLYGSGFPKSLDVSKAIDRSKTNGDASVTVRGGAWIADRIEALGLSKRDLDSAAGTSDMGGWWASRLPHRVATPTAEQWAQLEPLLGEAPEWLAPFILPANTPGEAWQTAPVTGQATSGIHSAFDYARTGEPGRSATFELRGANSDAAREWEGWGTALKPAFEPVICARKPLIGTVARNVLAYGTGALNIDACRTPGVVPQVTQGVSTARSSFDIRDAPTVSNPHDAGRWPTNVVLDESQAAALDAQTGVSRDGVAVKRNRSEDGSDAYTASSFSLPQIRQADAGYGGGGGASRFFPTFRYEAKAPSTERPEVDGTQHATVKPLELMRWLVRLTTRPGGRVLDPFAGSGTTGEAALLEGMEVDLIELEADHLPLILQRVRKPLQPSMFGDWDEATA